MSPEERLRRSVHIGAGGLAFALPQVPISYMIALTGLATVFNLWMLPRLPGPFRLERQATIGRGRLGLILYPAVLCALCLLYCDDWRPPFLGWLALAFGDGLAPVLAALKIKGPPWPWRRDKAIFASCLAFAIAGVLASPFLPAAVIAAAMTAAVLAESLPKGLDDNLSVPFAAALTAGYCLA